MSIFDWQPTSTSFGLCKVFFSSGFECQNRVSPSYTKRQYHSRRFSVLGFTVPGELVSPFGASLTSVRMNVKIPEMTTSE